MKYNIIYIMKEKLNSLSKAEKQLALWIMENPQEVINMSVTNLAKQANSSPATIVRLCYSLGLSGFTDLKIQLSKNLPQIEENLHTDIIKDETIDNIKKKLKFNLNNSFEETFNLLNDEVISQAIDYIEENTTIFTFGLGASGIVSEDIYQKFTRIGRNVIFSKDHHLMSTSLVSNSLSGTFIAISNSGEKQEVIHLARIAKNQNIPVIVITSSPDSSLAVIADCLLITSSGSEAPIRSSATNSMMVQLFAADILFSTYASKNYEETMNKLNVSKQIIETLK
ncbi:MULTISPECIES: MurR/RpiR family transcriptional regulator [Vagococcus]|uniref:Transcriptional regulator, RpiR family n=1 Tax=Vagococcus fluvialis bH819 TaxID=1255619 RepID=A0A1X6WPL7_9ENTE|nr:MULTISPECIES: MurR/RpiR family transcriptional regulator [Vagococcus]SLM85606.1 Transcriptional regulator, RpiR family [Vagococcus fluvialis bH819]